ncbi:hypothetical protein [Streptomyces tremellae]|uniref:hypothetical protein n=1 Tax=Streptomyces tremellae TaxID=1124239 RepID=UPI0031EF3CCC
MSTLSDIVERLRRASFDSAVRDGMSVVDPGEDAELPDRERLRQSGQDLRLQSGEAPAEREQDLARGVAGAR